METTPVCLFVWNPTNTAHFGAGPSAGGCTEYTCNPRGPEEKEKEGEKEEKNVDFKMQKLTLKCS